NEDSTRYESFAAQETYVGVDNGGAPQSTCDSGGLLDYPHYTRPAEFHGVGVPSVLSSGNHEEIRRWRRRQSLMKTLQNRPELLSQSVLSDEDRITLRELRDNKAK